MFLSSVRSTFSYLNRTKIRHFKQKFSGVTITDPSDGKRPPVPYPSPSKPMISNPPHFRRFVATGAVVATIWWNAICSSSFRKHCRLLVSGRYSSIIISDHTVGEFRFPLRAGVYLRSPRCSVEPRGDRAICCIICEARRRTGRLLFWHKQITANGDQLRNHFVHNKRNVDSREHPPCSESARLYPATVSLTTFSPSRRHLSYDDWDSSDAASGYQSSLHGNMDSGITIIFTPRQTFRNNK